MIEFTIALRFTYIKAISIPFQNIMKEAIISFLSATCLSISLSNCQPKDFKEEVLKTYLAEEYAIKSPEYNGKSFLVVGGIHCRTCFDSVVMALDEQAYCPDVLILPPNLKKPVSFCTGSTELSSTGQIVNYNITFDQVALFRFNAEGKLSDYLNVETNDGPGISKQIQKYVE